MFQSAPCLWGSGALWAGRLSVWPTVALLPMSLYLSCTLYTETYYVCFSSSKQSGAHSFTATSGVLPEDTGTKKNEASGFDAPILYICIFIYLSVYRIIEHL